MNIIFSQQHILKDVCTNKFDQQNRLKMEFYSLSYIDASMYASIITKLEKTFPNEMVIPERKVLVQTRCDYSGKFGEIYELYLPYDFEGHKRGIYFLQELKERAIRDCIAYARELKVYPVTSEFCQFVSSKTDKESISVKRSSGVIENDWKLFSKHATCRIDGELCVPVCSSDGEISKLIPFDDFCSLNSLTEFKDQLVVILEKSLDEYYI